MAIKKLRQIINDGGYNVKNIQSLPVTPKMYARDLQAAFDKNVDNLINAIDGSGGLIESVQNNITQAGGGDMSMAEFATTVDPDNPPEVPYPVDRAIYANSVRASVVDGILYLGTTPQ